MAMWIVVEVNPLYEVSKLGKVRTIKTQRILKRSYPRNGYPQVSLQSRTACVHHLVAFAFIGPRPPGYDIHHKNTDKDDARVSNLEYKPHWANTRGRPLHPCKLCGDLTPARRVFCSAQCREDYHWPELRCSTCGILFYRRRAWVNAQTPERGYKGLGVYCSRTCFQRRLL